MPKHLPDASTGRQRAYDHLRDTVIVDPKMQGRFINEQEIASVVGVSRTPVREALLLLVADGLVELIPNRGALVPQMNGREIAELFELRGVLERYAASNTIAASRAPHESMARVLAEQTELAQKAGQEWEEIKNFIELDREFHQLLIAALGNDLITTTYSRLRTRQILTGVEAIMTEKISRPVQVCEEHEHIVQALRQGDVAAAQTAIDEHLQRTLDALLRF